MRFIYDDPSRSVRIEVSSEPGVLRQKIGPLTTTEPGMASATVEIDGNGQPNAVTVTNPQRSWPIKEILGTYAFTVTDAYFMTILSERNTLFRF